MFYVWDIIDRKAEEAIRDIISEAAIEAERRDAGTPLEGMAGPIDIEKAVRETGDPTAMGYAGRSSSLVLANHRLIFDGRTSCFEACLYNGAGQDRTFAGLAEIIDGWGNSLRPHSYSGEAYGLLSSVVDHDGVRSYQERMRMIAEAAFDATRDGRLARLARREWAARKITCRSGNEPAGWRNAVKTYMSWPDSARTAFAFVVMPGWGLPHDAQRAFEGILEIEHPDVQGAAFGGNRR